MNAESLCKAFSEANDNKTSSRLTYNMSKKTINLTISVLVFLLLAAVVAYMQPRRTSNFTYYFEQGKPWSYELLTAEEDFPIYKTETELNKEREQVLQNYTPFFNISDSVLTIVNRNIESAGSSSLSAAEKQQLKEALQTVYRKGVVSFADWDKLTDEGWKKVKLVDSRHVASQVAVADLFTPKTAYSEILSLTGNHQHIRDIDLNVYLLPNLTFDTVRSEKLYADLVASVSLTNGMVQKGERIIDKGEIVTEDTYQILVSMRTAADEKTLDESLSLFSFLGVTLLVVILVGMLVLYLVMFRPMLIDNVRNIIFICILIATVVVIAALVLRFLSVDSVYIVPFALVPIMLRVFYDSRTAFFCHLITVLMVALMLPSVSTFILVQVAVGLVTVVSLKDVSVRSQLIATAAFVFLTQSIVYTACYVADAGSFYNINWIIYTFFFANALLLLAVYGLVYISERSFGFTSALTLVELTNVNSGVLLEFAQRAPGTFQHSLQVSNLATEAAKCINANVLLVRVGALYHDIGKMANPGYFIENQSDGVNPLNDMPEQQAVQIIVDHVAEGLRMAQKRHLPSAITAFIATHHGTSKVRYFYNKYVNSHPGEQVDESLFRYPGPKPQTKETGILMMADAVEARSRSLSEMTEESIAGMVEQMISQQIADGLLSETPISLKDVEDIKRVFTESLCSMYHHRIAYPELKKEGK